MFLRGGDQAGGCAKSSPAWSVRAHFIPDKPDSQPCITGAKPEGIALLRDENSEGKSVTAGGWLNPT
jgi:hypothetical protein